MFFLALLVICGTGTAKERSDSHTAHIEPKAMSKGGLTGWKATPGQTPGFRFAPALVVCGLQGTIMILCYQSCCKCSCDIKSPELKGVEVAMWSQCRRHEGCASNSCKPNAWHNVLMFVCVCVCVPRADVDFKAIHWMSNDFRNEDLLRLIILCHASYLEGWSNPQVARLLEKREGELPEDFRDELERLKDKEAGDVAVIDLGWFGQWVSGFYCWCMFLVIVWCVYILNCAFLNLCQLKDAFIKSRIYDSVVLVPLITCMFFWGRNSGLDLPSRNSQQKHHMFPGHSTLNLSIHHNPNIVIERQHLQRQLLMMMMMMMMMRGRENEWWLSTHYHAHGQKMAFASPTKNWSTPFLLGGISWPAQQCSSQCTTLGFSDWDDHGAYPPDSGSVKCLLVWTHPFCLRGQGGMKIK